MQSAAKEIFSVVIALALGTWTLYPFDGLGPLLDERLWPVGAFVVGVWVVKRLLMVDKAYRWWKGWTCSPTWVIEASELPLEERRVRGLPRALMRFLPGKDKGIPARSRVPVDARTYAGTGDLHARRCPVRCRLALTCAGAIRRCMRWACRRSARWWLPFSELVGHVLIGGTTRSGKTRLLEVIVAEAIQAPGTVVVIDPKGDAELLIRTASQARRMGREFQFFSPAFPKESKTFNPFSMCQTTTELAARVQALMPGRRLDGQGPVLHGIPAGDHRAPGRGAGGGG